MTALTLTLRIDASQFESGRHLAAWRGLVPREPSTGGKHRLGAISRAGDERLRSQMLLGATAVIRLAKPGKADHRRGCCRCWRENRANSRRLP